jgi:glycosyltransferase involved in cell wall biosynthesis
MIKKKILVIAPYPITKPYHGGQKRTKALTVFYKRVFSRVKYVGIFHRGQYPDWSPDDMPLGDPEIIRKVDEQPYLAELITGEAIDRDIHIRSYMAKLLNEYRPDIIHIEQPFPYLGLKVLLSELKLNPFLIYGSQNIEYPLKKRILSELKAPEEIINETTEKTHKLEVELARKSDLVLAVNKEDSITLTKFGAKNILIVPNGIDRVRPSKEDIYFWEQYKKSNSIKKVVVFIGSGHPPNWEGFLKMVGDDTAFMPESSKILIAGGVANYFKNEFKNKNNNFWKGVKLIGQLEEKRLAALLEVCDLIILPITTARGSNLKTAEAILSGKKFVGTPSTLQGFEAYRNLPNTFIADSRDKFRESIIMALTAEYIPRTNKERRLAENVRWDKTLLTLMPSLRKIARMATIMRIKRKAREPARIIKAKLSF